MSDETPRLKLAQLASLQELNAVTWNEALAKIDALVDLYLLDQFVNTPPTSPADGDAYLIGDAPTGAWSGYADKIASCLDGAWRFYTPFNGLQAYVAATRAFVVYINDAWTSLPYATRVASMAALQAMTAAQMAASGSVHLNGYYSDSPRGGGRFVWCDANLVAASFTGTIASNFLTATAVTGTLRVGQAIAWSGGPAGVRIIQTPTTSDGPYRLSFAPAVPTATAMTAQMVIDDGYAVAPSDHPGTSTYGCMLRAIDTASDLTVEDFGARADITTLDQAAFIQNGIDCIARLGGGRLKFGGKRYAVSTLRISDSSVGLMGQGHGGNHTILGSGAAATMLLHAGSTAEAMVLVQPKATDTVVLQDNSVEGIFFEGNGTAAHGVLVKSACNGHYDINGHSLRQSVATFTVVNSSEAPVFPADTQGNTISVFGNQSDITLAADDTGYVLCFDGILDSSIANSGANASHNTVMHVCGRHKNGHALNFGNCDNILVLHYNFYRITGGTGNAIRFRHGPYAGNARGNMLLWGIDGPGGIYCEGTTTDPTIYASGPNVLQWRDLGNAPPPPVIEDGAVFYYAENLFPDNTRRWQSSTGPVRLSYVTMGHVVHNAGYCPVAPNASGTIPFPSDFWNCGIIVKALCTPTDVAVSGYKISADSNSVTITNTDPTRSAVFWWEVDALARPPVAMR